MPTPIQSSSVTAKLRSFFRLRGRQIFTLDETVVPTAQVEDLTTAPYRASHQSRFMMGNRRTLDVGRNLAIFVNTSPLGLSPVSLAPVPGVAVLESIRVRETVAITPLGARQWRVDLVSHDGLLTGIEFVGLASTDATNVDAARSIGTAAAPAVGGQVPIKLNITRDSVAPAYGTLLNIRRMLLPPDTFGAEVELLPEGGVVIGDNVALLIRGTSATTAGQVSINVVGSFYPLARS